MQKFRKGDEWWGFHPQRGWLRWDASLNDWRPQSDGPVPWAKSPFKRRMERKRSRREAALETLVPANQEETRLLAHVLGEPPAPRHERVDGAVVAAEVVPGNDEEARLLTHVLTGEAGPKPPMRFPAKLPSKLRAVAWTARALIMVVGTVLVLLFAWLAIRLMDALILPW